MKSVLNGRTFKYNVLGGRFHILPQSYKVSYNLCLNYSLQILLIVNRRDQVNSFRYINHFDEISHLVRVRKLIWDIKYLMSSFQRAAEAVVIWTEEN